MTAGVSSALVFGAPAGAALASAVSWRITLVAIAAAGLLVVPGLLLMREVPPSPARRLGDQLRALRTPRVRATLAITCIAFCGVFIPYTYLSQSYAPLVAALPGGISTALLLFGLTSVVGALASGHLADRMSARWMVVAVCATLAAVDLVVVVGRDHLPVLVVALLAAGYLSWSILTPQQHQLITDEPDHAAVLISFNAAAGYAGISLAGMLGAATMTVVGQASFPIMASLLLLVAGGWRALSPLPGR